MKKIFTHTAYVIGCDARVRKDYRRKIKLRSTKTMWIAENGQRWRRRAQGSYDNGSGFGSWPMYRLTDIQQNAGLTSAQNQTSQPQK